jgi:hypothetical protein
VCLPLSVLRIVSVRRCLCCNRAPTPPLPPTKLDPLAQVAAPAPYDSWPARGGSGSAWGNRLERAPPLRPPFTTAPTPCPRVWGLGAVRAAGMGKMPARRRGRGRGRGRGRISRLPLSHPRASSASLLTNLVPIRPRQCTPYHHPTHPPSRLCPLLAHAFA